MPFITDTLPPPPTEVVTKHHMQIKEIAELIDASVLTLLDIVREHDMQPTVLGGRFKFYSPEQVEWLSKGWKPRRTFELSAYEPDPSHPVGITNIYRQIKGIRQAVSAMHKEKPDNQLYHYLEYRIYNVHEAVKEMYPHLEPWEFGWEDLVRSKLWVSIAEVQALFIDKKLPISASTVKRYAFGRKLCFCDGYIYYPGLVHLFNTHLINHAKTPFEPLPDDPDNINIWKVGISAESWLRPGDYITLDEASRMIVHTHPQRIDVEPQVYDRRRLLYYLERESFSGRMVKTGKGWVLSTEDFFNWSPKLLPTVEAMNI